MENKKAFFDRLQPVMSVRDFNRAWLAYELAKSGHRGQMRKECEDGVPVRYFEHPRRTFLILFDELACRDPDMIITSFAHDVLEDTRFTSEFLEQFFGEKVSRWVRMLSKDPREGYVERLRRYADIEALIIKGCDRLDNLRSLIRPCVPTEFVAKQVDETRRMYIPLMGHTALKAIGTEFEGAAKYLQQEISSQIIFCEAALAYRPSGSDN